MHTHCFAPPNSNGSIFPVPLSRSISLSLSLSLSLSPSLLRRAPPSILSLGYMGYQLRKSLERVAGREKLETQIADVKESKAYGVRVMKSERDGQEDIHVSKYPCLLEVVQALYILVEQGKNPQLSLQSACFPLELTLQKHLCTLPSEILLSILKLQHLRSLQAFMIEIFVIWIYNGKGHFTHVHFKRKFDF
ncbi:hypothetical protein O6H91_Y533200 [Diphasiastrum complanatum]|nr:hypothetical protein O6H91_Y533200 [Diphasiastrum complanatum]